MSQNFDLGPIAFILRNIEVYTFLNVKRLPVFWHRIKTKT